MSERIIAACDGAAKGNPGPAGWAWVIADAEGRPERWESGPLGRSTNNVGELTALQRLLEAVAPGSSLEVRMDSQYAMKAVTQWLPNWKRNGWRTAGGKPVANQDLVRDIDALLTDRDVEFRYVPAHRVGGDPLNAIADQAASDAALTQEAAGTAHGTAEWPQPAPERTGPARKQAAAPRKRPGGASGSSRTLKAKFRGTCPCGTPYAAGEPITKVGARWGHPACAATAPEEAGPA
ncbi:ribonuclease H [Streptomyces sp. NPDC015131]|uniref:ribonuclease H family protein n=1 Tax=Streptomyces sp. NPDC015131 TaxID=3364941 RepID=UPI0036FB6F6F